MQAHDNRAVAENLLLEKISEVHDKVTSFQNSQEILEETDDSKALTPIPETLTMRQKQLLFKQRLRLPEAWQKFGVQLNLATGKERVFSYHRLFMNLFMPYLFGGKMVSMHFSARLSTPWWGSISLLGGHISMSNIIPQDSLAVEACLAGDLDTLQDELEERRVSPSDVTPDARPLLYVSLPTRLNKNGLL